MRLARVSDGLFRSKTSRADPALPVCPSRSPTETEMKPHPFFDAVRRGAQDSWPIMAAYLPLAFSFGLASIQAGYSPGFAIAVSALVFAGASQFALLSLLAAGASGGGTVLVVSLMNLRHLFYGPALLTHFGAKNALPLPVLAFGLTDEVFATATARLATIPTAAREGWHLGLQLGAYAAWVGGTAAGALLGHDATAMSPWLRETLAFILPAMFLALALELARHCRRSVLVASLAATGLLFGLTGSAGLAMIVGIAGGTALATTPWQKG